MLRADGAGGDHLQHLKPGQTIIAVADPGATSAAEAAVLRTQLLAKAEWQSIRRFVGSELQHDRVVAWSLVRLGLSQAFPVRPNEWVFSRREDQRPFVLAPRGLPPFQFSLSHTSGLIALLVTSAAQGGVDAERMERTEDLPLVASNICAPSELAALKLLSGAAWQERFFEFWTLKEAYAKARGPGPSLRWSDVAFEIEARRRVKVRFASEVAGQPAGWQFWRHRIRTGHMLAVALRGDPGDAGIALQPVTVRAGEQNAWLEMLGGSSSL